MLTTIAYRINNKTTYALEGSIFIAGAVRVQWLRDEMKFFKSAEKSGIMAEEVDHNQRLYFVPAFISFGHHIGNLMLEVQFLVLTEILDRMKLSKLHLKVYLINHWTLLMLCC